MLKSTWLSVQVCSQGREVAQSGNEGCKFYRAKLPWQKTRYMKERRYSLSSVCECHNQAAICVCSSSLCQCRHNQMAPGPHTGRMNRCSQPRCTATSIGSWRSSRSPFHCAIERAPRRRRYGAQCSAGGPTAQQPNSPTAQQHMPSLAEQDQGVRNFCANDDPAAAAQCCITVGMVGAAAAAATMCATPTADPAWMASCGLGAHASMELGFGGLAAYLRRACMPCCNEAQTQPWSRRISPPHVAAWALTPSRPCRCVCTTCLLPCKPPCTGHVPRRQQRPHMPRARP